MHTALRRLRYLPVLALLSFPLISVAQPKNGGPFSPKIPLSSFLPASATQGQTTTSASGLPTSAPNYVDRWLTSSVSRARATTTTVDMVMLHFCSDVIQSPEAPYSVDRTVEIFETAGVSAHYLIGRDGTVYRFVPENRAAYHAGRGRLEWMQDRTNNVNEYSIGIEMHCIGSARDMGIFMKKDAYAEYAQKHPENIGYTEAQYQALNGLLTDIRKNNPAIVMNRQHIVGHEEYAANRRTDPGELFDYTRIGLPKTR